MSRESPGSRLSSRVHELDPEDGRITGRMFAAVIVPCLLMRGILASADVEAIERTPEGISIFDLVDLVRKRGPLAYECFLVVLQEKGMWRTLSRLARGAPPEPPPPPLPLSCGAVDRNIFFDCTDFPPLRHCHWLNASYDCTGRFGCFEVKLTPARTLKKRDDIYSMGRCPRGFCLILNNKDFPEKDRCREGSELDVQRMAAVFSALHFHCGICYNLTKNEMKSVLLWASKLEHLARVECLAVILMSHGEEGTIEGVDGNHLPLEYAYERFNNVHCPALQGKPKLFFVQACRGGTDDQGTDLVHHTGGVHESADSQRTAGSPGRISYACPYRRVPSVSDMWIGNATRPGHKAFLNTERGSWFFEAVFNTFAKNASTMHLEKMTRQIQHEVMNRPSGDGGRQTPHFENMGFLKKLYFNPGLSADVGAANWDD